MPEVESCPTVQTNKEDILSNQSSGKSALMIASQGAVELVEHLLKNCAAVNDIDIRKKTAAMFSCQADQKEILRIFLENENMNGNKKDKYGHTVLMYCCKEGILDLVRILVNYRVDVNLSTNRGRTSLMIASQHGYTEIVDLLVKHNANLEPVDIYQRTALLIACEYGHEKIAEILLNNGSNVGVVDKEGKSALMHACSKGNVMLVKLLLTYKINIININRMDGKGKTALMYASLHGFNDVIDLLVTHGADVNIMDKKSDQTAFICACKMKKVETISLLIKLGADVNQSLQMNRLPPLFFLSDFGWNKGRKKKERLKDVFIHICKTGCVDVAKILLKHSTNLSDEILLDAFLYASSRYHYKVMGLLIEHGVDWKKAFDLSDSLRAHLLQSLQTGRFPFIEATTKSGIDWSIVKVRKENGLLMACKGGQEKVVRFLLKNGVNLHSTRTVDGITPLMYATESDNENLINLLLEDGENVNAIDDAGRNAIMHACFVRIKKYCKGKLVSGSDNDFIPTFLLKLGANLNCADKRMKTVLMYACEASVLSIVEVILAKDLKIDINAKDKYGQSALMFACRSGSKEIVQLILKYGCDVNVVDKSIKNALSYAVNYEDIFMMLIDYGANVDAHNEMGKLLIWKATENGKLDILKFLHRCGGDIFITSNSGETLLMLACRGGWHSIVEYLIQEGLDIDPRDSRGMTPLFCEIGGNYYHTDERLMTLLLELGANVNLKDPEGKTALAFACRHGVSTSKLGNLLKHGANVDLQSLDGKTPLMYACEYWIEHLSNVELLVKHGANMDLQCNEGKTALIYAVINKNGFSAMKLLVESGADINIKCKNGLTAVTYAFKSHSIKGKLPFLLQTGKLTTNGRLNTVHRVGESELSLQDLIFTLRCGIFEWEMCNSDHLVKLTAHALKAGACPGRTIQIQGNASPLVAACYRQDSKTIQLVVDNLYFYPEDYRTVWELKDDLVNVERCLDSILAKPLSLWAWSFLTVSKAISEGGSPCQRNTRVQKLPLPDSLKKKLQFLN